MLRFCDLRSLNVARVPLFGHTLDGWNELEWAGALCGEAGEAANVAKKLRRIADGCNVNTGGDDAASLRSKLGAELADVVIYADLLAARVGVNLADAVAAKFNEVSDRVGFVPRLDGDATC